MNKIYTILIILMALIIGFGASCMLQCCKKKLAVVDVQQVVNQSAQVQALKTEQTQKAQELAQWLQNAQNDVKNEKDKEKQQALLKQYNAEFASKTENMKQDYAGKVKALDANITQTIIDIAKKKGYKFVVAKGVMIYGGDDITDAVAEIIN